MNTVSRTHDYMLEHLKEKLINERLARHRISPNLVQRLFTAAIWSAGTSVLASQTDGICGKRAVCYLHKRAAGGIGDRPSEYWPVRRSFPAHLSDGSFLIPV